MPVVGGCRLFVPRASVGGRSKEQASRSIRDNAAFFSASVSFLERGNKGVNADHVRVVGKSVSYTVTRNFGSKYGCKISAAQKNVFANI